ncbi:NAD(P)-binding protein [Hymenopellis radicata]|nr:NAD(P)-binding protein [Hymenopellis radicata]
MSSEQIANRPPIAFQLNGDVSTSDVPGCLPHIRHRAKVALLDFNEEWAKETQNMIAAEGGVSEVIQCDVTSEESCKKAVEKTVELFGAVHILVNIVGVGGPHGTVVDVDLAAWDRDFRTNVTSMVLMSRFAIPEMRKVGRGSIVNMSSVSGLKGGNPGVLYPTSKGAIIQLTRAMAAHHGPEQIRIYLQGMVFTPMVRGRGMTDEMRQARINQNLMKVEGDAWDVAYAILYLASKEARWITGVILPVDAGTTAGTANRPALKEDKPLAEPEK